MTFKVYYNDKPPYTGDPEKAPGLGVLTIVQYGGGWYGHDYVGLIDCLALPGLNRVIVGRSVGKLEWEQALKDADSDSDFPPREDRYIMHGWAFYCWHGDAT